jgi:fibronectin type 3 domain-containing protein
MVSYTVNIVIIEGLSTNENGPMTNNEHYLYSRGLKKPGQPRNATIEFDGVRVEIGWDLPSDNESTDIIGYRVYKGIENSNYTLLSEQMVDDIEYLDFNFTYGINYSYYIVAYNQEGEGNRTAILSIKPIKPPDPPKNVRVFQASNGVSISWDPPDFEENMPVVLYRINRKVEGSPDIFRIASSVLTVYLDKNILPNTTYHYYIFAVNDGGVSDSSQKVSIEIGDLSIQDEPEPINNDDEKFPIGILVLVVLFLIIFGSIIVALVVMKKPNLEDISSKEENSLSD